ncbi:RING finger protein 225-like [Narcine bancroftii]|uniref:RING finger protein 225-like n=1 Tax=Narcine bancroftii TaxID=1343680 RepID=UPI003831A221
MPEEKDCDLECAVCFTTYNNVFRAPKQLVCGHTFCLECLARMNMKSQVAEAIQCPLCRKLTPVPKEGLPKLGNDSTVLSCLPEAMQKIYSVRFNRGKGRLFVKKEPESQKKGKKKVFASSFVGEKCGRNQLDHYFARKGVHKLRGPQPKNKLRMADLNCSSRDNELPSQGYGKAMMSK